MSRSVTGPRHPFEGGYLIAKAHQISGRIFARLLKEAGGTEINPAQGRVLFALWKVNGISITTLAKETALEPSTLTSMLDRLESAGFVRRWPRRKTAGSSSSSAPRRAAPSRIVMRPYPSG